TRATIMWLTPSCSASRRVLHRVVPSGDASLPGFVPQAAESSRERGRVPVLRSPNGARRKALQKYCSLSARQARVAQPLYIARGLRMLRIGQSRSSGALKDAEPWVPALIRCARVISATGVSHNAFGRCRRLSATLPPPLGCASSQYLIRKVFPHV